MIATIIVTLSLVLAAAYTFAWLTRPNLRRQIEKPKYDFQEQVQLYNLQCSDAREPVTGCSDES